MSKIRTFFLIGMRMGNKLKIGVIGLKGLPAFGGAATVGESLIHELYGRYDFTVYSVSSHAKGDANEKEYRQIIFKKFPVRKLNILYYYIRSAIHAVFMAKYDIIHLHHVDGAIILPILRMKYRVICTSHAQPYLNEKWPPLVKLFFRINERIAFSLSNKLTVVSAPLAQTFKEAGHDVTFIPNGINLTQNILPIQQAGEKYILFAAGRIIPLKGLHVLLKALHRMDTDIKLLVIGDLEQIPSYKNEILALSKGLNVEFIPIIREKQRLLGYMKNALFFVFPSYSENMSMTLLEVAYTGTPVICSDIPANVAIFNSDEVLFFKTNDVDDLSTQMKFAMEGPPAMKLKADEAFKKLVKEYDWRNIGALYEQLYLQIIGK
jgi:glycosyltransferase involved in cell wall biosynthesis